MAPEETHRSLASRDYNPPAVAHQPGKRLS